MKVLVLIMIIFCVSSCENFKNSENKAYTEKLKWY